MAKDEKPAADAAAEPTKEALMEEARELDVAGRSSMDKEHLAEAVAEAKGEDDKAPAGPGPEFPGAPGATGETANAAPTKLAEVANAVDTEGDKRDKPFVPVGTGVTPE